MLMDSLKNFFNALNLFLKEQGKRYKEWKSKEPERQAARVEKIKQDIEIRKLKLEEQVLKAKEQNIRMNIIQKEDMQREKSMNSWKKNDPAGLFGGDGYGRRR